MLLLFITYSRHNILVFCHSIFWILQERTFSDIDLNLIEYE